MSVTEVVDTRLASDLATAALNLARRFAAGATLWAVSPEWEAHAHHVAVEFVHPVNACTRTLPAVALVGADPVDGARLAVRPGEVVLAVATAADRRVRDLMRRAPAWGAGTIWIGFGERPAPGSADAVLWLDPDDDATPATGRFVVLYHLLWELTHVCLEHPPLLVTEPDCADEVCITCSDEGRLAEVVEPETEPFAGALVRTAEGAERVDVTVVGAVASGDLILVHAGAALTRLPDDA